MPRIGGDEADGTYQITGSNFKFTGARLERLGATEYTLVTIAVDVTGSITGFADELRKSLVTAVEACKRSPRSNNLLIRVITFSTALPGGVAELHGFKLLADIDPTAYPQFRPDGFTPLYDAAYSAIGAMVEYGNDLMRSDFLANGIAFIITDGADNRSTATPPMIKNQIAKVTQQEALESLVTVLVGINAATFQRELEYFRQEAGINQYVDAGEATAGRLARLAAFVSRSVSSQSQAIGTGGPSQNIVATI